MEVKPKTTIRPWGSFTKFIDNSPCTVKILEIKKGESLSLQSHKLRQEFWYLISGKGKIVKGKTLKNLKTQTLKAGQSIVFPKNTIHKIEALEETKILEISTGKFKENDEIRYSDKYGRV